MHNVTISVDEELYRLMKEHRQIRWSEVARRAMREYAKKLAVLDSLIEDSKMTEKDAIEIGEKIKHGMAKRHGQ